MTVTTSPTDLGTTTGSSLLARRFLARLVDTLVAVVASAVICWPLAWGAATDAVGRAGFTSVGELIRGRELGATVDAAMAELHPVIGLTLAGQVFVVWLYETVATSVTGTTVGKGLLRLRVARQSTDGSSWQPTRAGLQSARDALRRWWHHPVRMAARAAVAVLPAAAAVATFVAAVLGVPGAVSVSMFAIAAAIVVLLFSLAGPQGLHGQLTGTRVVRFDPAQTRAEAGQRMREAREQAVRDGRRRAEQAGRDWSRRAGSSPSSQRALRSGQEALQRARATPRGRDLESRATSGLGTARNRLDQLDQATRNRERGRDGSR